MITAQTITSEMSREAFEELVRAGRVGKLHRDVLRMIHEHGPSTQMEIASKLVEIGCCKVTRSVTPRFAELVRMMWLQVRSVRQCNVTGRMNTEYELTPNGGYGLTVAKKATRKELLEKIASLEQEINVLRHIGKSKQSTFQFGERP